MLVRTQYGAPCPLKPVVPVNDATQPRTRPKVPEPATVLNTATMSISAPEDGLHGPRFVAAFTTLVIAIGMASLDTSIANTALPTIAADVNASPADSVWVDPRTVMRQQP